MRIAPTFNVAYRALRRNKMRSVLVYGGFPLSAKSVVDGVLRGGSLHEYDFAVAGKEEFVEE